MAILKNEELARDQGIGHPAILATVSAHRSGRLPSCWAALLVLLDTGDGWAQKPCYLVV